MMKQLVCLSLMGLSVLWIIGSAGALDQDLIGVAEMVARTIPAAAIMIICLFVGGFF